MVCRSSFARFPSNFRRFLVAESPRPSAPGSPLPPQSPKLSYPDPIPKILPFGTVNLFSGAPGSGKTILLADWCARLRDGRSICRYPTRSPTAFAYLAADRSWDTFDAAFRAAGFPDIPRYCLSEDDTTDPRRWREATAFDLFTQSLTKLDPPPGSLVIIDPISPLFIAGDPNRARDVAISLHWYRRIARLKQITLLCCMNVSKPRNEPEIKRVRDRASGSLAFGAYCDTQLSLDVDEDDVRTLVWSPRRAPEETFRLAFNPHTELFELAETSQGMRDEDPDPARDRPTNVLKLFPAHEPIHFDDLLQLAIAALQISRASLHRDITALLQRGLIERPGHGLYQRRKLA